MPGIAGSIIAGELGNYWQQACFLIGCHVAYDPTSGLFTLRGPTTAEWQRASCNNLPVPAGIEMGPLEEKLSSGEVGRQLYLPGFEEYLRPTSVTNWQEAEQYVSQEIQVPRNIGDNRFRLSEDYFTSKSRMRVPEFDPRQTPGKLVEVKWRNLVWADPSENLPDFIAYAQRNGLKIELWVKDGATIDESILKWTRGPDPLIILKTIGVK